MTTKPESQAECCDHCNDGDGHCAFPYYGRAPAVNLGNFVDDPDASGLGVYLRCPKCGHGGGSWRLDVDEGALYFKGARVAELEYESGNDAWRQALAVGAQVVETMNEYEREMADAIFYCGAQIWASIQRHNGDPRWDYVESGETLEILT